jgi:hypothetical protein
MRQRGFDGLVLLAATAPLGCDGFRPGPMPQQRRPLSILYSSVGPPNNNNNKGGQGGSDNNGPFGDFLIPKDESENMFKAREYMNENSLPISYDYDKNVTKDNVTAFSAVATQTRDAAVVMEQVEEEDDDDEEGKELKSAELVSQSSPDKTTTSTTTTASLEKVAQDNPYIDIVSRISPSDLISKFSTTAHPRVQTAVRNTILGLLGGLPKMAFDTTTVTTGQKLASLMFQLQMTGYMFKVRFCYCKWCRRVAMLFSACRVLSFSDKGLHGSCC